MTELLNKEIIETSELINDSLLHLTESYKENGAFINEMMDLTDSMQYSLLAGGKRIRPLLVFAFADLFGKDKATALPFAQAIEMVHTYSLIHDDLPCMDNDDFRRGKPTNHKVYGEATAVLAGDALLTEAFSVIANSCFSDSIKIRAINILASRAGVLGMVGGQTIDLTCENKMISQEILRTLQKKKTGMLIEASCLLGCISAGCDDEKIFSSVSAFSHSLGLSFQITDDILDVTGSSEELGKNVGSDFKENKSTFVSVLGLCEAKKEACRQIDLAKKELKCTFGDEKTLLLCDLCDYILERRN